MIRINNKHLPPKGFVALTAWPLLFVRREYLPLSARTLRHEYIHARQQAEMGIVPFFIWYGAEWLIRRLFLRGNAYRNISFEREAYANEGNERYLQTRKAFAWINYLKEA
ncbi:MAG: hypothetical protein LBD91_03185 [Prevotellaceae bacterium]|jgi:hypothetical protein|nr:hypothetical protein [Prevotellaceae bacterium]